MKYPLDTNPRKVILRSPLDINPRYAAYAAWQGNSPPVQLRQDQARYTGGRMRGFVLWLDRKTREYKAEHKLPPGEPLWYYEDFDLWLAFAVGRHRS